MVGCRCMASESTLSCELVLPKVSQNCPKNCQNQLNDGHNPATCGVWKTAEHSCIGHPKVFTLGLDTSFNFASFPRYFFKKIDFVSPPPPPVGLAMRG